MIDYIFYTHNHFHRTGYLELPAKETMDEFGRYLPSRWYPSDHFALMAELEYTAPVPTTPVSRHTAVPTRPPPVEMPVTTTTGVQHTITSHLSRSHRVDLGSAWRRSSSRQGIP